MPNCGRTSRGSDDQRKGHHEGFGDPLLANAALDRLAHRATVIAIRGRSYRLADRPAEGEVPMAAS